MLDPRGSRKRADAGLYLSAADATRGEPVIKLLLGKITKPRGLNDVGLGKYQEQKTGATGRAYLEHDKAIHPDRNRG
jgi:hypothetical protein